MKTEKSKTKEKYQSISEQNEHFNDRDPTLSKEQDNFMIESIDSKFNFFECFLDSNEYYHKDKVIPKNKYQNKIQFPIVDTILIDNSQIIAWLFTDKNHYVMRHSKNQITKDAILNSFLNIAREYLSVINKPLIKSNENVIEDMSRFISISDTQMNSDALLRSKATSYLHPLFLMKFILLTFVDSTVTDKKKYVNMFEFIKYLNDYNKIGSIKMIQNTLLLKQHQPNKDGSIDLNKELIQPLVIHYSSLNNTKNIKLYLLQRTSLETSNNGSFLFPEKKLNKTNGKIQANLSDRPPSHMMDKDDIKDMLIPICNETLHQSFDSMVNNFIAMVEKFKKMKITKVNLIFLKFNFYLSDVCSMASNSNNSYCLIGAYFLKGISYDNPSFKLNIQNKKLAMQKINDKKIPKDILDTKGDSIVFLRVTKENVCFGEFCSYEIPKMLKNIKNNDNMEKLLEKYTPVDNRFSMRNKCFQLPKRLPVFQIKRAHDNPKLVNMVLKSYSIYPTNFNQSLNSNRQKNEEYEIYVPKPSKFEHLNYDSMYNQTGVCYNCFQIYTLINTFIEGMDECNCGPKKLQKSRSVLYRGVNFNHANYINHNNENSRRFDEEIKQIAQNQQIYSKIVFDERLKCLKELRKEESNRIYKNRNKGLEESNRRFQYNINVNPKVLQWKAEKEQFSSKRPVKSQTANTSPIKQSMKRCASSISTFRLHMGFNSSIYNLDSKQFSNEDKGNLNMYKGSQHLNSIQSRTVEKTLIEKENEKKELDIDIFLLYRNLLRKNEDENIVFRFIKAKKEAELKPNLINTQKTTLFKQPKEMIDDMPMMALEEDNLELIEEEFTQNEKKIKTNLKESKKNVKSSFEGVLNSFRVTSVDNFPLRSNSLREEKIDRENMMDYSGVQKDTEERKNETKEKLKNFVHLSPTIDDQKQTSIVDTQKEEKKQKKKKKKKKKIQVSSIFYRKNYEHGELPYYFISTPIAKFNEANFSVNFNPLLFTQNKISNKEYQQLSGFERGILSDSLIFVYDNHTAVPYKVISIKSKNKRLKKGKNLIIFVINDFFESYTTYSRELANFFSQYQTNEIFYRIRLLFFNLPGQPATLWSSQSTLNNLYYCDFFDHFLFYLYKEKAFDKSYRGVIFGFGNGGQIGMTYLSNYDKFGDFFDSLLLINSYVKNDSFLSQSMLEIQDMATKEKNKKLIEFFIKSITYNPSILSEIKNESALNENGLEGNSISLNGYSSISKGYFYNIEVDLMKVTIPTVFVHSTQNSFISIQSISNIINDKKEVISGEPSKDDPNIMEYDFSPLWKGQKKKVFVPINCSHDLNHSIDIMILLDILASYMKYYFNNIK